MLSPDNLPEESGPPDPFDTPKESENSSTDGVPIHKDLDSWIRRLHLSTLPKGLESPLTTSQFLNGKILTDIALAQELIQDCEVISNSAERLCRLVVERLFKEECVEAKSEIITLLLVGNAWVLERTLYALKALRQPSTPVVSLDTNALEISYQGFKDGEEKFSPASLSSEDSDDERLSSICPEKCRSISSAPPGPSAEQALEEKCYELSRELGETRFVAENWKWQYEQLDVRFKAVQESNDTLESTLISVRSECTERHKKQIREITLKHEKEKDELLININDVSSCAQEDTQMLQRELKRLQGLLAQEQLSTDEILQERNSVIEYNTKLQREKAELSSELQVVRRQLKEAHENFKLKLNLASEEQKKSSERWENEKTDLLESFHIVMEESIECREQHETTLVEDHVSNLQEDIEASFRKPKKIAKVEGKLLREKRTDVVLRINPRYRKLMQNRQVNPFDFFSLLLLFIFRVLRYIAGINR